MLKIKNNEQGAKINKVSASFHLPKTIISVSLFVYICHVTTN